MKTPKNDKKTHAQRVHEVFQSLEDLFQRKNANYGNSIAEIPLLVPDITPKKAIFVRMSDKINRICALANGQTDKVNESLNDTVRDLVVYGINWLAMDDSTLN